MEIIDRLITYTFSLLNVILSNEVHIIKIVNGSTKNDTTNKINQSICLHMFDPV
jgi:hypothetical protein